MELELARKFLQQIDNSENPTFAFRSFSDNKEQKNPALTTNRYGHFQDIQDEFIRLNTQGAGIFFTVNQTDGRGYAKGNIIRVRAVFVDLDGAPLEPVEKFPLKPHIIIESSNKRYHAYWIVDEKRPLALPMFEIVQAAIAERFNGDKSVKDLPRVMRLPGFFHKKKEPFLSNLLLSNEIAPYSADDILSAFGINKAGKKQTLPAAIAQGQRETRLLSFAGSMRRVGGTEESILAALKIENMRCVPPMEMSDLVRIAHSVAKYPPTNEDFARDKDGKIYANSQQNIKIALEKMGIELRLDTFADQYQFRRDQGEWERLQDEDLRRFWLEADEAFRFRPSKEFFFDVILDFAMHRGSFHPVREYLDKLEWDGKPRIGNWLVEYAGAEDTEYIRAVGRLILVAAVRRVRQPGCKFDEMLVLESEQGKEKSSALQALCPDPDWFTDDLPLNCETKEVIERTGGKWIIEAAELSGMRKGDIEHLKSFLSRSRDTARLAYGKVTTEKLRHFIVVGTTNSSAYLRDSTGNRRFWPVKVEGFKTGALKGARNQIWAEAAHYEAAGESIRLPEKLWKSANIEQEHRRLEDPWEISITECLEEANGRILTEDIWKIVGHHDPGRRTQSDSFRISDAMRRCGFEKTRIRVRDKLLYGYMRGTEHQRKAIIKIELDEDQHPKAVVMSASEAAHGPGTSEWEQPAPGAAPGNEPIQPEIVGLEGSQAAKSDHPDHG